MKELDSGLKIYDITELEELKDLKNGISNQEKQGYLYIIKYLIKYLAYNKKSIMFAII